MSSPYRMMRLSHILTGDDESASGDKSPALGIRALHSCQQPH